MRTLVSIIAVAPFAGAWIEILGTTRASRASGVAPFAGAWIEMQLRGEVHRRVLRRTLRGCVD